MPDDNFAHARFDADAQRLSGFATRVDDFIVPDIFRLQIGHVDESHAARAVAKDKKIACQRERRGIGQIQPPQLGDETFVDSPLAGTVDSGIDMPKRIGLLDTVLADGFIVNGSENTHVKRYGIAHDAPPDQKAVVLVDQGFGYGRKRNVFCPEKTHKTVQRPPVVPGRSEAVAVRQFVDLAPHRFGYRYTLFHDTESHDDIVRSVTVPLRVQFPNDTA